MTAYRHPGANSRFGRLGVKALTGAPVQLDDLYRGQHLGLEPHQLAHIRQGGVPAGGEMPALPAIDGLAFRGRKGGDVGGHAL